VEEGKWVFEIKQPHKTPIYGLNKKKIVPLTPPPPPTALTNSFPRTKLDSSQEEGSMGIWDDSPVEPY
jgi:hypothetical protein